MQLGQTIVNIRKEHQMTQEQFAAKFNVTRQTVSNWENEKSYPDLLTLIKISDEFDCSLDTMLKENPKMTEKMNNYMKYGESHGYIGGICAIFLFIFVTEMLIMNVGSWYIWLTYFIVIFVNADGVKLILKDLKEETLKTKLQFAGILLLAVVISSGVLYYIK